MYTKVLIAVDLAGDADTILSRSASFVSTIDADYQVIYCVEKPVTGYGELAGGRSLQNLSQLKHELLPKLKQLAERAEVDTKKVSIEVGHVADTILSVANKGGFDLIIVGSHGRHGVRLLLGSTASSILHQSDVDVLALRIKP